MKLSSKYLVITSDFVLPGLITFGVIFLFWLCFYSSFFTIKEIDCEIDYEPCKNTALEVEIHKLEHTNIFRLNEAELTASIIRGEYTVRSAEIKRTLPSHLLVSMHSVYPTLAVIQIGDPRYVTLDDKYRVISVKEQDPNVTTLTVSKLPPFQIGQVLGGDMNAVFSLCKRVSKDVKDLVKISLDDKGLVVLELKNDLKVIMSPNIDADKQIRLLQAVLSDSTITKDKSELDVRFAQPILK